MDDNAWVAPKRSDTVTTTIWMAGSVSKAEEAISKFCDANGLCVTISPCMYIYTGGNEGGFRIGLINYPRFPTTPNRMHITANNLARAVANFCEQESYSVEHPAPYKTEWYSRRGENK